MRHRVQPLIRDMPLIEHFASTTTTTTTTTSSSSSTSVQRCPSPPPPWANPPDQQERHVRQRVRVQGGYTMLHPGLLDAAGKLRPRGGLQGTGEVLQQGLWDMLLEGF